MINGAFNQETNRMAPMLRYFCLLLCCLLAGCTSTLRWYRTPN